MRQPEIFEILLAEDDEADVELMCRAFKDAHVQHTLRVVRDGQAAIDFLSSLAKERGARAPAMVLLDLQMPRRSGLDVLRWIKENDGLRCVPVMIFSSSALPRDIEPAYANGASIYIVKPSSITERADVAAFIADWMTLAKCPVAATHGVNSAADFAKTWLKVRPSDHQQEQTG